MTQPATISADYTLRPSELASVLALLVEARRPCIVWGPPGAAKSMIAQQVAAAANRRYVDVRALLLDPVDLRGIPPCATAPTARAGRPRPSCPRPTIRAASSSTSKSCRPPSRWYRRRCTSLFSTGRSANTSSPRASR